VCGVKGLPRKLIHLYDFKQNKPLYAFSPHIISKSKHKVSSGVAIECKKALKFSQPHYFSHICASLLPKNHLKTNAA